MQQIKIPGVNKRLRVTAEKIIRVQASSNYSRIYFANGKVVVVAKILHWFEAALPETMFARVHRSHLVNKTFIKKVKDGPSKSLVLFNGETISISRRKSTSIS